MNVCVKHRIIPVPTSCYRFGLHTSEKWSLTVLSHRDFEVYLSQPLVLWALDIHTVIPPGQVLRLHVGQEVTHQSQEVTTSCRSPCQPEGRAPRTKGWACLLSHKRGSISKKAQLDLGHAGTAPSLLLLVQPPITFRMNFHQEPRGFWSDSRMFWSPPFRVGWAGPLSTEHSGKILP